MRKWITIIAVALCFCLCLSLVAQAEETETETATPEIDVDIIDFSFCTRMVTAEEYAQLETNYPQKELSYLQFLYFDRNGMEQKGEIIVNRNIEFDVLDALQDIYDLNLPIYDIQLFVGDGFDVAFWADFDQERLEDDPYNQIFDRYEFVWNENQLNGVRHYTIDYKIPIWYP